MTEAISVAAPAIARGGKNRNAGPRSVVAGAADHRCSRRSAIAATYDVFSITFDEPAHIAAGMQLLDKDEFTYEPLHPPLARVAAALGPYLAGYRSQNGGDMWIEGRRHFLCEIRPSRHRDADPGQGRHAAVSCSPASFWSGSGPSRTCRPGRGRSRGDRARQSAGVPGAFRAGDDRRAVCRDLHRAPFSRSCCGSSVLPPGAGCCSAPPSRWRCAPSCRRCCSCRPRAARCCSIAGCATGRIGGRSELFAPWRRALAAARGFSADGLGGLRLQGRPALRHQRRSPTASRELAAFADSGEPVVFSRPVSTCTAARRFSRC